MALVTIAIPVFERFEFFIAALESALAQTIPCPIIVSDNASSHKKFREVCDLYPGRVTYYENVKNLGMFENWNRCIRLADTEYVMVLGDDDLIHPRYCETLTNAVDAHPELDVFFSSFVTIRAPHFEPEPPLFASPFGILTGTQVLTHAARWGLGVPTISMALRKTAFSGYYSKVTASNDWLWL